MTLTETRILWRVDGSIQIAHHRGENRVQVGQIPSGSLDAELLRCWALLGSLPKQGDKANRIEPIGTCSGCGEALEVVVHTCGD